MTTSNPRSISSMKYLAKREALGLCLWGACKTPRIEPTASITKPRYCAEHLKRVNDNQRARWRKRFGKVKPVPQPDITFGEAT